MVEYTGLRENSTSILEREIKRLGYYRNVKGCILMYDVTNLEEQGW